MKRIFTAMLLMMTLYLGLYDDHLALWDSGTSEPQEVYPYRVSLYPNIDRISLEKGIEITSNIQLSKLIEDFLS